MKTHISASFVNSSFVEMVKKKPDHTTIKAVEKNHEKNISGSQYDCNLFCIKHTCYIKNYSQNIKCLISLLFLFSLSEKGIKANEQVQWKGNLKSFMKGIFHIPSLNIVIPYSCPQYIYVLFFFIFKYYEQALK